MLLEVGWNPILADDWIDREGNHWRLAAEDYDGDCTVIVDQIVRDAQETLWRSAEISAPKHTSAHLSGPQKLSGRVKRQNYLSTKP